MSLASGQTGAAAAPAGKDGRAAGEVRVLVVDDESYLADLVAAALKYEGWQTRQRGSWQTHRNLSAVSWAGGGCWT